MRIMFFIPRMGSGGAERVISILANEFAAGGDNVHISQLIESESFYRLDEKIGLSGLNIRIRRNNKIIAYWDQARFFFKGINYIKKMIRNYQPDVVISFMRQTCIMMWLARLTGCKVRLICSERNDPTVQNRFVRKLMKRVFGASDLLVCQGEGVANYFSNVKNKTVIPNPVVNRNQLFVPFEKRRKVVSAVGRLDKQKDFDLLIKSFAFIRHDFPDYCLEIYGEGPERNNLSKLIEELQCSDSIKLMGAHKDVHKRISDTSLFVMSSDYEGFPNALAEAMSIGLPVISTDFFSGAARELLNNDDRFLVPVGSVEKMTKSISNILSNDDLRKEVSLSNMRVAERYNVHNIVDRWRSCIKSTLVSNNR